MLATELIKQLAQLIKDNGGDVMILHAAPDKKVSPLGVKLSTHVLSGGSVIGVLGEF